MAGGAKPSFLKDAVAYYVMGAEEWRYTGSLENVTSESKPLLLNSASNPTQIHSSGMLQAQDSKRSFGQPDHFVYDPHDVSTAELAESHIDPSDLTDQRLLFAQEAATNSSITRTRSRARRGLGFFRLSAWIALDQPDTDLQAQIFEITLLTAAASCSPTDRIARAIARACALRVFVTTRKPLLYDFKRFTFVSRQLAAGSRLRLVVQSDQFDLYTEKLQLGEGGIGRDDGGCAPRDRDTAP